VLNGLPAKYEVQVSKLEEWFSSTSNPLSIQDMRNELNLKYAQRKCLTAEKTKMDQALVAFHRYKGKFSNCGKFGHKMAECCFKTMTMTKEECGETKKSKNGKKPTNKQHITCFGCRKKGHYQSKCPENENDDKEEEMDIANLMLNG